MEKTTHLVHDFDFQTSKYKKKQNQKTQTQQKKPPNNQQKT